MDDANVEDKPVDAAPDKEQEVEVHEHDHARWADDGGPPVD